MRGNWIRVNDSVPVKDQPIVIVFDPELLEGVTAATFDGKNFRSISDENNIFNTVTHWMPLPEPPFDEEEEKQN